MESRRRTLPTRVRWGLVALALLVGVLVAPRLPGLGQAVGRYAASETTANDDDIDVRGIIQLACSSI